MISSNIPFYKAKEEQKDRIHFISPIISARVHYDGGFVPCLSVKGFLGPCCQKSKSFIRSGAVIIQYGGGLFEGHVWFFGERTKLLLDQCDLINDLEIECEHFEYQRINIKELSSSSPIIGQKINENGKIYGILEQLRSDGLDIIEKSLCKDMTFRKNLKTADMFSKKKDANSFESLVQIEPPRKVTW